MNKALKMPWDESESVKQTRKVSWVGELEAAFQEGYGDCGRTLRFHTHDQLFGSQLRCEALQQRHGSTTWF